MWWKLFRQSNFHDAVVPYGYAIQATTRGLPGNEQHVGKRKPHVEFILVRPCQVDYDVFAISALGGIVLQCGLEHDFEEQGIQMCALEGVPCGQIRPGMFRPNASPSCSPLLSMLPWLCAVAWLHE